MWKYEICNSKKKLEVINDKEKAISLAQQLSEERQERVVVVGINETLFATLTRTVVVFINGVKSAI